MSQYSSQTSEALQNSLAQIHHELETLEMRSAEEKTRRAEWKLENERRRHNYVPLLFELLKQFAEKNMLDDLFKQAIEKKNA